MVLEEKLGQHLRAADLIFSSITTENFKAMPEVNGLIWEWKLGNWSCSFLAVTDGLDHVSYSWVHCQRAWIFHPWFIAGFTVIFLYGENIYHYMLLEIYAVDLLSVYVTENIHSKLYHYIQCFLIWPIIW